MGFPQLASALSRKRPSASRSLGWCPQCCAAAAVSYAVVPPTCLTSVPSLCVSRERVNKRRVKEMVKEFTLLCRGLHGTEYTADY